MKIRNCKTFYNIGPWKKKFVCNFEVFIESLLAILQVVFYHFKIDHWLKHFVGLDGEVRVGKEGPAEAAR